MAASSNVDEIYANVLIYICDDGTEQRMMRDNFCSVLLSVLNLAPFCDGCCLSGFPIDRYDRDGKTLCEVTN